ncbi:MAG: dTDP-4-dehydrorhamnose 3,5-epimerase family protein [Planctomycetaceae bacterium]
MKFSPTKIDGVWQITLDRHEDDRGWFARSWCVREFEEQGINPRMVQCNLSVQPETRHAA